MTAYKIVEWSYPTSPNAKQYGFYKTGCYTFHTASPKGHVTHSGHATLQDAQAVGDKFQDLPWHPAMSDGWRSK